MTQATLCRANGWHTLPELAAAPSAVRCGNVSVVGVVCLPAAAVQSLLFMLMSDHTLSSGCRRVQLSG